MPHLKEPLDNFFRRLNLPNVITLEPRSLDKKRVAHLTDCFPRQISALVLAAPLEEAALAEIMNLKPTTNQNVVRNF